MKKYLSILSVAVVAAYATSAFAQGTVVFINNASSLVKSWTSATDQTLVSVAPNAGFVQLGYAPTGTAYTGYTAGETTATWLSQNPGWTLNNATTPIALVPGRFNGGTVTLTGVAAGTSADYVVFGWTGGSTTFDGAIAGGMTGVSGKLTSPTGGVGTPPSTAVSLANTFTGLTLTPSAVPEPSTFALAGLGAAALLIFRRRK